MASLRQQVLHGYKRLMRARNVAFPNDAVALSASRTELKTQFLANASEKDKASVQEMLAGIDEVEDMLRGGIAQGVLTEEGNYNVKVKPEMASAGETTDFDHMTKDGDHLRLKGENIVVETTTSKTTKTTK